MSCQRVSWAASLAAALAFPSLATAQDGVPKPEELFQQLDKNEDGKLTADEVPDEQRRFFERSVRVGDKNGDGVLTKDEFLQASRPADSPNVPLAPLGGGPGRPGQGGDLRARFEMMDRNKDGKVSKDELPEQLRDRMAQIFERLGKDELTLEEFGRFAGGPGGGRPDPGEMFNRLDRNGDGKITKSELPDQAPPFVSQIFERIGKDEVSREDFQDAARRMFAQGGQPGAPGQRPGDGQRPLQQPRLVQVLDSDKDGRLSKDELAKLTDKFNELDRNSDGQLDPSELMGPPPDGFPGGRPEPQRPPESGRPQTRPGAAAAPERDNPLFTRMDKNGDGKISKDEGPERMRDNFARMDKDGDGFLTGEELRGAGRQRRPNAEPQKD